MNEITKRSLIAMIISAVSVCLNSFATIGWAGLIFNILAVAGSFVSLVMAKNLKDRATAGAAKVFIKIAFIVGIVGIILGAIMFVVCIVSNIINAR